MTILGELMVQPKVRGLSLVSNHCYGPTVLWNNSVSFTESHGGGCFTRRAVLSRVETLRHTVEVC